MKTYKYITLAVLALGFTACTQDDDFAPQQEDIVKIASANIATEVQTRVNTLGDGTLWENNDRVLLVNNSRDNKNSGIYTYNGTAWSLAEGMVLYALSDSNDFTAYYPAVADFTLPTDQRTEAGIKSADRMIATQTGVATGNAVELNFVRQNAKVTITPSFNTEFGDDATISSLTIAGITPYHPSASDYTAILAPATGFTVTVKVKVGEAEQTLTATTATPIEAGKHYTFNLTVGKAAVNMGTVSVSSWTGATIDGGVAEEVLPDIDASTMTAEQVKAKVAELLKAGDTSFTVRFAPDTQTEMHKTVIEAIGVQTTTGAVISGNNEYTIVPTFGNVLTAWEDGTTLTLLENVVYDDAKIVIRNKSITLDLNGKELKTSQDYLFDISVNSELTIRDSGENGAITTGSYFGWPYGTLTLESGTLNNNLGNYGTFNMTGGKVIGNSDNGLVSALTNEGTANISGGELSGWYGVWTRSNSVTNISGSPVITGKDLDDINGGSAVYCASTAEITISGTPTLTGGSCGEIGAYVPVTLNTQPTTGTWRIYTSEAAITKNNGIFAIPGEGIDLDASKFVSLVDGYEVQKLEDGSLALVQVATE